MMTKTQHIIAGLVESMSKTAMHGYPDYQMTEPQPSLYPQQSLPNYEPEDQETGLLSKLRPTWGLAGSTVGGFGAKGLVEETLRNEGNVIDFMKGRPNPLANARLLQEVQSGNLAPKDIPQFQKNLASEEWIKNNLSASPEAWAKELGQHRKAYWGAMAKGPLLGSLLGAGAGLGAGLLYDNYIKESSSREPGLLSKAAEGQFLSIQEMQRRGIKPGQGQMIPRSSMQFERPSITQVRAAPPKPEMVPSKWNGYVPTAPKPNRPPISAFADTALHQAPAAGGAGLLGKAKGVLGAAATVVSKSPMGLR